jgi:colicin import membrane protein
MVQFIRQHWVYLIGAVLLHVLFAGVFALTMVQMSRKAPPPQLAIQAVVVDSSLLAGPTKQQQQRERERERERQQQQQQQREKELAEQRQREQEVVQREAEQRAEQERQTEQRQREEQEQQRQIEERQLKERQEEQRRREAEAEKQKQAEAEKQRQADAERKRVEEIKRKQEEEATKRRAADEARAQAAREEELQRQLADEEGVAEARNSPAMAAYVALIQQHVERRWNRPPSAGSDLDCEVRVVQAPGGSVLSAQVTRCNGDAAVRQSIETAVLRSSPLPPPPDPRLFERTLVFLFKPEA